jgi:glycine/D-amino acid oxidase-like deaminating enzyme
VAATHALVAEAQNYGTKILTHTRALSFVTQSAKLTGVETTKGVFDADIVVLAAGTDKVKDRSGSIAAGRV